MPLNHPITPALLADPEIFQQNRLPFHAHFADQTSPELPLTVSLALRAAFAGAAEAYKLKNDKLKAIYGKTGTATQPDGKNTTMLAFSLITQRREAYVAVITRSGTDSTSAVLKEPARALLKHTLEVIE